MKIRPIGGGGSCVRWATDVRKVPVAFRSFTTAPTNQQYNDVWRSDGLSYECDTVSTDALFVYSVEFVNVEPGGTCDNHQSLKAGCVIALLVFVACHVHTGMIIFISEIILHLLL